MSGKTNYIQVDWNKEYYNYGKTGDVLDVDTTCFYKLWVESVQRNKEKVSDEWDAHADNHNNHRTA